MSYEEKPVRRIDLADSVKKRVEDIVSSSGNWRLDSSNKLSDMDAAFKLALGKSKSVGSNYYEPTYNKSNVRVYPERDNAPTKSKKGRRLYSSQ